MNYAVAETTTGEYRTSYTIEQIESAFAVSQEYVVVAKDTQQMTILEKNALVDGVDPEDLRILSHWAELNNRTMKAFMAENRELAKASLEEEKDGKFQLLFGETVAIDLQNPEMSAGYWSLTACGITWGSTSHPHTTALNGHSGYSSKANLQNHLVNSHGYYQVQAPWADPQNVGLDYGKINSVGVGGCGNGEFRDQAFIYSPTQTHPGHTGWHNLQHVNEPNPDLPAYPAPTYWWNTYVAGWHLDQW